MIETRIDEAPIKQFIDGDKLPIFFQAGNPFAFRQGGFITTAGEREPSFALHPLRTRAEIETSRQPLAEMLQNQIDAALDDLSARPENPHCINNVGVAYLNAAKFDEAYHYFRRALDVLPSFLTAKVNLAKVYTLTNRPDDALRTYQELADVEDNVVVLMNMAQLYIQKQEFERAKELLNRAIATDPENVAALNNRAGLMILQGKIRDAISDLRRALRVDVRDADVHNNIGVCYILLNSPKKAVREFKAALMLDPLNGGAIKNLSRIYLSEGNYSDAITLLAPYLLRHKDELEARILLAKVYFLAGKNEESISHLNAALQMAETKDLPGETASLLNNLGVVFRNRGEIERAREFLERSLTIQPKNRVALQNLTSLLFQVGRLVEAREVLDRYLNAFPNDAVVLSLTGQYYSLVDEDEVALEYLERAIATDPKHPLAHSLLSALLVDVQNDCQKAIGILQQGLKYNPKDIGLLNNLAYAYLMLGDTRTARSVLDSIDPKDYNLFLTATRGLLLLKEGNVLEGSRLYNSAAKLAETKEVRNLVNQKKNLELARHAWKQGDLEKARRLLRQALSFRTPHKRYFREASRLLRELDGGEHGKNGI